MVDGLRMQTRWLMFEGDVNPFEQYNPLRPIILLYNTWRMNKFISEELDSRTAGFKSNTNTKSIIVLALAAYVADQPEKKLQRGLDCTFR